MKKFAVVMGVLCGLLLNVSAQDFAGNFDEALERVNIAQQNESTRLTLRDLKLEQVPAALWSLEHLEVLYLTGNNLRELPPQIAQLTNLRELHLTDNALTSLPPQIGQLRNLEVLTVAYNALPTLPTEVAQLQHLHTLNLRGNPLTALPADADAATVQRLLERAHAVTRMGQVAGVLLWLSVLISASIFMGLHTYPYKRKRQVVQ